MPGKGANHEQCLIDFNLDFESGVCSIAVDKNGKANKSDACSYCYSAYLFKRDPDAFRIKEINEAEFKKIADKYPAHILRLGKNFETGNKKTRPQLYQVLEYCEKYSMQPILTTKLLEFDPKIVDLIKKANGVVHISLGDDSLEPGAVKQGSTNRWRLAQAIKYKKANCPIQVRMVSDVTLPMSAFYKKVFSYMGSRGILLTPLRYDSKECFQKARTDVTWDEAKEKGIFTFSHGALQPAFQHDDWKPVREKCGAIGSRFYCNNCSFKINFNKKDYKAELIKLKWNTEST